MSATDTGLEKAAERVPDIITTPSEYRAALGRWDPTKYNVLTPFTNITSVAPSFGIIASVVQINVSREAGEVYSGTLESGAQGMPFLKGKPGDANEEFALAKIGLRKIAECGGISTDAVRTDPRTIPNYWEFKATATYRGLDGSNITRSATFEWDLRDGSDRMKGWQPKQVTEARKNGLRNCEARAINAAIRECGCGIKQKYTRAELARPFLVVRVAFQPDMSDPAVKQMVTQQALGGAAMLYPRHAESAPALESHIEEATGEPRQVGSGSTTQAGAQQGSKPDPDAPPNEDAVRVVDVKEKLGETKGRKWLKFEVTDSRGVVHSTFDVKVAELARKCQTERAWVEIASEGEYHNIIEIAPAGTNPVLPGLGDL